ncbi:MAG: PAS domain-containing protein [Rhizomicrobium sp.]
MKHKNSHLLVGYWSRLRKGRAVPDQTDIDPRAIKRMLSQVFILDVENPQRPIYRLAGTQLCERFGFELRGTGFLAHWEAQSAQALSALLRQALTLNQPVCLSSIGASADCGMVELETVLCPVSFNGGLPTRFVGMIQILGDQSLLAGKPIAFQRLAASQLIREDDPLPSFDNLPPPPPPSNGLTTLRNHPRAPHLRLVVSQSRPATATVHFADQAASDLIKTLGQGLGRLELV